MKALGKQLLNAQHNGVYQLIRKPEEVERVAKEAGLTVFRIDVGRADNKTDFLAHVAKTLSFPEWFGGNWDALHDCLSDLEWLPTTKGYVLVFENMEPFASRNEQEFKNAKNILDAAAEYWKTQRRPFWAFVVGPQAWDSGLPNWPAQLVGM
jgi:RNAse (barnase) inhibitor barstar